MSIGRRVWGRGWSSRRSSRGKVLSSFACVPVTHVVAAVNGCDAVKVAGGGQGGGVQLGLAPHAGLGLHEGLLDPLALQPGTKRKSGLKGVEIGSPAQRRWYGCAAAPPADSGMSGSGYRNVTPFCTPCPCLLRRAHLHEVLEGESIDGVLQKGRQGIQVGTEKLAPRRNSAEAHTGLGAQAAHVALAPTTDKARSQGDNHWQRKVCTFLILSVA